ncbi:ArsR/SmtB family transcription factor [Cryptosporangium minutisporangium]|uniref:Helix-turn-helix transcriptional regulator n=1 Tax=Cryptosporangium minutisporangium TaxID=113569 RepID=A0ABP6SVI4_9ACTN
MRTEILAAIGDPLRFEALRLLLADDGLAQAALAELLGVTPSRLGNHLAALRAAGLVDPVRVGRSTRYTLRQPDAVRALVGAIDTLAGGPAALPEAGRSPYARARTCYDHLAGEVGVRLLDRLVAEGALVPGPEPESVLQPGETLDASLTRLGVPYPQVGRRKLAVGCLDATAGHPHLGGALGSEVLRSFLRRGLLLPGPAPRSLIEHPNLAPLLG